VATLAQLLTTKRDGEAQIPPEVLDRIYSSFQSPETARNALRVTRGEVEGQPHPLFAQMAPAELAQVDRYIDARTMNPLAGAVNAGIAAPAYEAYKAGVQAGVPGLGAVNSLLASVDSPHVNQYAVDETSSPASLGNVRAAWQGAGASAKDSGKSLLALLSGLVSSRRKKG
jgi:molybdopterin-guanine dinucleotide biosynthesis protein A